MANLVRIRPGGKKAIVTPPGFFYANKSSLVGPQYGLGIIAGGNGYKQIGSLKTDTTFVTASNTTYDGYEIWGRVENAGMVNVKFTNSILHGELKRGSLTAAVHSNGDNHRGLILDHCLIESRAKLGTDTTGAWGPVGRQLSNEWCGMMRGGNFTMTYCEAREWSDFYAATGYGLGTNASDGTQNYGINVSIDHNWWHSGWFMDWTAAEGSNARSDGGPISGYYPAAPSNATQSNLYTHCDGVQHSRGKNFYMGYSCVGGLPTSFDYTHNVTPSQVNQVNACDDIYNSNFLIKQEVAGKGPLLENITYEYNLFGGGRGGINIVTSSDAIIATNNAAGAPNNFPTIFVQHNRFMRRVNASQPYMLNGTTYQATYGALGNYVDNVMDDTGLPAPISSGY